MTNHIGALDGVRGLAVILVLLFHFGLLPSGWVGVQLFFVLSGFLITRILLDGRREPLKLSLQRFYWRRSLRILPVFLLFMTTVAVTWLATGLPASFASDWPWLVTFAANLARLRPGDIGEPFVHMWSLAVEEQFYLVWPFAVLMLPMRQLKWVMWMLLLGIPLLRLASFGWMEGAGFSSGYAGRVVYVLPFTQFDAFAAGAVFAIWPSLINKGSTRNLLLVATTTAACGFAVLVAEHLSGNGAFAGSFGYSMYLVERGGYFWGYSILNLLFAGLIAAAMHERAWSSMFSTAPLVYIGKISYGLYVYHLPLLLVVRHWLPRHSASAFASRELAIFALWVALSVLVAAISYYLVEKPILRLKDRKFMRVLPVE
ncbi:MAG: acyltransferase [Pseudomonadota bacterium]